MLQEKAKIVSLEKIGKEYFRLGLESKNIARKAQAGQFVEIRISDPEAALLPRPFGIHRVKGDNFYILVQVLGKGTQALSQKKPGEYLDIIGPLGKGFDYKSEVPAKKIGGSATICGGRSQKSEVLVAGGMGVAPLIFLQEKLTELKIKNSKFKIKVLIGAKTKEQLLCEGEFKKLGCEVKVATDDGSKGFKGRVTELLKHLLSTMDYRLWTIYACGPKPMLKEIARLSARYNIRAQISLEAHMACGIGACLGCVVNTKEGFKRVCKEGPVFNADEIVW